MLEDLAWAIRKRNKRYKYKKNKPNDRIVCVGPQAFVFYFLHGEGFHWIFIRLIEFFISSYISILFTLRISISLLNSIVIFWIVPIILSSYICLWGFICTSITSLFYPFKGLCKYLCLYEFFERLYIFYLLWNSMPWVSSWVVLFRDIYYKIDWFFMLVVFCDRNWAPGIMCLPIRSCSLPVHSPHVWCSTGKFERGPKE